MSIQGNGFWTSKGDACLANVGMAYDGSARIEPKRAHQWLMNSAEAELPPNKKQAIEVPSNYSFSGIPSQNLFAWGNLSSFHPFTGKFADHLVETEDGRTINIGDRNTSSIRDGNLDTGRKAIDAPLRKDSLLGLSISHNLEDPRSSLKYGGIRKVKVSQVRDESPISMGLAYNRGDPDLISAGHIGSFMTTGQSYNNRDGSTTMGHSAFNRGDGVMSMGQSFNRENGNIIFMGQSVSRADAGNISTHSAYKENDGNISIDLSNIKGDGGSLLIGHSLDRTESSIICFGRYNDDEDLNASGRLYDLLTGPQSTLNQKDLIVSIANRLASTAQAIASDADISSKKKQEKKSSRRTLPTTFPSNVRSLLATGMLDGIQVKYVAWLQEKQLRGVIKGTGYLCGCQTCNYSKVVNAYEFEQHASCKTKHPNNHIHFENGKSVYGVVLELRSTPQNMLFDVLQTVTGSPIDQKAFHLWKESFLAATQELQRIYGKGEASQSS